MSSLSLSELFRNKVSGMKDIRMKKEAENDVGYSTGYLVFDFLNGNVIHVKSKDLDFKYNSIGIVDGSMVTVIGRTGCGKTTFVEQASGNIIRPFKTSCIYEDNIEGGIVQSRRELLLDMDREDLKEKYIPRNSGITAENFYERIKMIHDLKIENRESFEYDTGLYTETGERIYKFEPTVYILDSLALLMPEKYTEEEELSGQMSTTAAAKTNSSIFRRIIPMLKAANIILFVINHITEKVEINMFAKTKAQVAYLKAGETVGGGRVALYVTNLLIRLDDNSKLKESEGFGIHGSIVEFSILKSRTCASGRSINMVFDFEHGFDKELTLLLMLKEQGIVVAKGAYMRFSDNDDVKFTQKLFKTKLEEDEQFQQMFMEHVIMGLNNLITDIDTTERVQKKFDVSSAILNMGGRPTASVA